MCFSTSVCWIPCVATISAVIIFLSLFMVYHFDVQIIISYSKEVARAYTGNRPILTGQKRILQEMTLLNHTLFVYCRLLSVSGWFWSRSGFLSFFLFFALLPLTSLKKREGWKLQRSPNTHDSAQSIVFISTRLFKNTAQLMWSWKLDQAYLGNITKPWNSTSAR